ncbi:4674_t:CDS:2 [Ambispora gerdemannii]|uniref:4674_t:CDS:1 n=1 Tax=Ambispora gerdemannii TaxID=144530 RepID=A0A9N8WMT5_9GLOM|nr:4674_t:CDS:2 [Ambispora gerdemannii]
MPSTIFPDYSSSPEFDISSYYEHSDPSLLIHYSLTPTDLSYSSSSLSLSNIKYFDLKTIGVVDQSFPMSLTSSSSTISLSFDNEDFGNSDQQKQQLEYTIPFVHEDLFCQVVTRNSLANTTANFSTFSPLLTPTTLSNTTNTTTLSNNTVRSSTNNVANTFLPLITSTGATSSLPNTSITSNMTPAFVEPPLDPHYYNIQTMANASSLSPFSPIIVPSSLHSRVVPMSNHRQHQQLQCQPNQHHLINNNTNTIIPTTEDNYDLNSSINVNILRSLTTTSPIQASISGQNINTATTSGNSPKSMNSSKINSNNTTTVAAATATPTKPQFSYSGPPRSYYSRLPLYDRPFKCDQCPQSFNRNHDLKRHKRIHLAVKPYPCPYSREQPAANDHMVLY